VRQRLCSLFKVDGSFIAVSSLSAAAVAAGFTEKDVLGAKAWSFHDSRQERAIRDAFSECLFDGGPVQYTVRSEIGGVCEHWHCTLRRVDQPVAVLCFATQVFPGEIPRLTPTESRILSLLADDMSPEQIADVLRQSRGTLSSRLHRLREKFGVHTNHGLVAQAARLGAYGTITASG